MLGHTYRIQAENRTTQTLASGAIVVTARREKRGSDGSITFESSEATLWTSSGTIANAAYAASSSISNGTDKWEGGTLEISVTAPASSNGDVILRLQRSTDGGTTWPEDGTGLVLATINFTTSGTKIRDCYL